MEKLELANFHYEYQLAGQKLPSSQISKINKEFEYIAFLWGGVKKLATYQAYDKKQLELWSAITPEMPMAIQYDNQQGSNFWGQVDEIHKKLNSKKTSYEIGRNLNCNPKSFYVNNIKDVLACLERAKINMIIRSDFSVSGRGIFVFRPGVDSLNSLEKKIGPLLPYSGFVVEPFYQREEDFSVLINDSESFSYRSLVSREGVFRGIVLGREMPEDHKEVYREIWKSYKELGANQIQVDSFTYLEKGERLLYPLVEVNKRKTMGEFALRLKNRLAAPGELGVLYMKPHGRKFTPQKAKVYELNPKGTQHDSYFCLYTKREDRDQDLLKYQQFVL